MEFFITAGGIPVHVFDSQKGEQALVFLHGYLETLYIWEEFIKLLPDYYRVITLDLPGHGLSCTDSSVNSMEFCSDVIYDLTVNKLHLGKSVFIGHSMGGYIAQAILRYHPDSVESLVFMGSNPYSDSPDKLQSRLDEIQVISEGKLSSVASSSIPVMYSSLNLRKCDSKIQETIEICETHDPSGIVASLRGMMARLDSVSLLNDSPVQSSFIFGDDDFFLPFEKITRIKADLLRSDFHIVPGAGHNMFIESPIRTLECLLSCLHYTES